MNYCWCPKCNRVRIVTDSCIDNKDRLCLSLVCGHYRVFQLIFSELDLKGAKYDQDSCKKLFDLARRDVANIFKKR